MSRPVVLDLSEIKAATSDIDLLERMSTGFIALSRGQCVIPPVGELIMDGSDPGEVHIKYGYLRGGDHYVVKIASGFPMNRSRGMQSGNGLMLLFDQATGELVTILHDEGYLTDLRTAAAGALACRALAPSAFETIGVVGTGVQASLQLEHAARATGCRHSMVWGRNPDRAQDLKSRFDGNDVDIEVEVVSDLETLVSSSGLIITCTSATCPIIRSEWVRPGTHITCVGSDTPEKQEVETRLLSRADLVVVDSLEQARLRGEVSHALRDGSLVESRIVEIGRLLTHPDQGRTSEEQVTVADLTGVAVQDLMIAEAVIDSIRESS